MQHVEPVPRFAHQLVYDHVRKVGTGPHRLMADYLSQCEVLDYWYRGFI